MSGSEKEAPPKVQRPNLDRILVEEIGQFGRYQARVLALAVLVVVFVSWSNTEYLFTVARIPTRCVIPECESETPEFSPPWLGDAVPPGEQCQRYGNASVGWTPEPGECPPDLFDTTVLRPCDHYVYENTYTVVYDFDLGCDEWRRTFIGSARTMGTLVNLPFSGYVSDRWGRRPVLIGATLHCAWVGIVKAFANSYIGYLMLHVFETVIGSGAYNSVYILMMELTGPKYRLMVGAAVNSSYSVGQILLGLIAWLVPNWRQLTLVLYAPHFIVIVYFWLIGDSVRWLLSKDRFQEVEALLERIAKVNKCKLSSKCVEGLQRSAEEDLKAQGEVSSEPWLIVSVFRNKRVLLRCAVAPVWWVTSTFVYYGMTIHSVNMAGNSYVNFIAVTAAEVPGYWAAAYLLNKMGRKPVLIAAFWICAACQLVFILIPSEMYGVSLSVYLVGKFCIAAEVTTLYMYTAELMPTRHRNQLFAFCSMIGRVGAIVAPLTPAIGASTFEEFPSVLFGSFALVSGCLVFFFPETRGRPLADTMQDAEDLGKHGDATYAEMPFVLFGGFALVSGLLILLTPKTLGTPLPDSMRDAEEIGLRRRPDKGPAQPL